MIAMMWHFFVVADELKMSSANFCHHCRSGHADPGDQRVGGAPANAPRVLRGDGHQAAQGCDTLRTARHRQDPARQGCRQPNLCHVPARSGLRAHSKVLGKNDMLWLFQFEL
jgi:hypothetical protein